MRLVLRALVLLVLVALLPVVVDRVVGVLLRDLFREPGGEDVRVAMVTNLSHRHSSHMDHTSACLPRPFVHPAAPRPDRRRSLP